MELSYFVWPKSILSNERWCHLKRTIYNEVMGGVHTFS